VLHACEATIERLVTDRHYFARPARTLFTDIRLYFPISEQQRVWQIVSVYIAAAQDWLAKQPQHGFDVNGNPLECRATTRRGTPCQRMPLAHNGYCPSHQHLAETEELEESLAAYRGSNPGGRRARPPLALAGWPRSRSRTRP
jgi:hypothetical protein